MTPVVRGVLALFALALAALAFVTSDDERRLAALMLATGLANVACVRSPKRVAWGSIPISLAVLLSICNPNGGWGFGIADYPAIASVGAAFFVLMISDPPLNGVALGILVTLGPALFYYVAPGLIDFNVLHLGNPGTALVSSTFVAVIAAALGFALPARRSPWWFPLEVVFTIALVWACDQTFVNLRLL